MSGAKVKISLVREYCENNNKFENKLSNYDKLIINLLPESLQNPKNTLYMRILTICGFVASLTDGFALQLYKKING